MILILIFRFFSAPALLCSVALCSVSQGLVPKEDNASDHVLELLKPYTTENGGPLEVERVHFTPGRGNVIIKYQGQSSQVNQVNRSQPCECVRVCCCCMTHQQPAALKASSRRRTIVYTLLMSTDDVHRAVCRSTFGFDGSSACFHCCSLQQS